MVTEDGKGHGVHAFVAKIRDRFHRVVPGITIGDMGKKIGLDGIDNGWLEFNGFRVPKDNLLNKFSDVTVTGEFKTDIPNDEKRFAMMLGGLSAGRMALSLMSPVSFTLNHHQRYSILALTIALRYATVRTQFGPNDTTEQPLISYPLHTFRLLPYLSNSYALMFAMKKVTLIYQENKDNMDDPTIPAFAEFHSLLSIIKPLSTWNTHKAM